MKKDRYILTVTLNPVIDKIVHIQGFKTGLDFREEALSISAGGKGINVSQVLQTLEVPTVATGFLSQNGALFIERELERLGIRHDFEIISGTVRTSLTILDPKSEKITRVMERGPSVDRNDINMFKKRYKRLLKNATMVVLSGRSIPGADDVLYAELIDIAHEESVPAAFDTSGKPFPRGLKAKPFLIKPNIEETEELFGERVRSISAMKKCAIDLSSRGIDVVAITRGSRGALIAYKDDIVYATPPRLERTNPVGCGDAFIAGFCAARLDNKPFDECVRLAIACGSANALKIDPGHVDRNEVRRFLKEIAIIRNI